MRALLPAVVVALAVSSPAPAQTCSDAEKARLEQFDRAWSEAARVGDRARLQAVFADDFSGATLTGSVDKTAVIDDVVRAAERTRASGQIPPPAVYDNYIISCTPMTATVTHRSATTTTVSGREQTTYFRTIHVLEKRAGRWQVVGNAGHPLTDGDVLMYMENDRNEAAKAKNVAWFERNLTDDATQGSSWGELQMKADLIASMKTDKTVYESRELSELSTRVDGNVAIVTGVNRVRGRDEQARPFDRRVRFTDTFIRRDGRWQLWASQGTLIP